VCDGLDEAGTAVPGASDDGWGGYLAAFHDERPGVTEDVLADASADDGGNPYDWLARALPRDGVIVDVACGSGPLAGRTSRWIGLDRGPAELRLAASIAPGRVVLADAACPPLRAGVADAVVCSMALMLLDNPGAAVAEMARLLRDGGRFAAVIPVTAPLTLRDRMRYVRLLAALRLRRLPFRHPDVLADPRPLLASAGLTVVSADRRRFAYPLAEPGDARLWVRSLYLPGLDPRRLRAAHRVTRRWTGSSIGIPLLRLVATKNL
jgi:SAM-dependent methyltransferase